MLKEYLDPELKEKKMKDILSDNYLPFKQPQGKYLFAIIRIYYINFSKLSSIMEN